MGISDINVTLANEAAMRVCASQWNVLEGHGESDHNPIEIVVTHFLALDVNARVNGWYFREADWALHRHYMREVAAQVSFSTFCAINVDEEVAWVSSVSNSMFGRHHTVTRKRVKRWTRGLIDEQRARRANAKGGAQLREQINERL